MAGLVAGAFSMGTGEYLSVTLQNQVVHPEVAVERQMHAQFPAPEQAAPGGRVGFAESTTILLDGADLFTSVDHASGVACRMYAPSRRPTRWPGAGRARGSDLP